MKIIFRYCIFTGLIGLLCSAHASAQSKVKLTPLDKKNLPAAIKYEKHDGIIQHAVQWTDKNGINMAICTETGVYEYNGDTDAGGSIGGSNAELYAYHYLVNNNAATLTWKVSDYIRDCPVDIEAHYIPNTFAVTDLNKNGLTEVWLMYVTVCHGDVSPLDMKIIMYEDKQKFAMRGQNKIKFSPGQFIGGEYKFDEAFAKGPAVFRDYAKKMWKLHIVGR